MKKLKEINPYSVLEDPKIRFRHESLLQDLEDLQKDTEVTKKKLRIMKQKKHILSAEVGFLKQRYKYLKSNPNFNRRKSVNDKKGKSSSKKQILAPSTSKKEKKTYKGTETPIFGRGFTSLKASNFDFNQGKRIHGGSESGKQVLPPIFDLNQASAEEEEELQAVDELPLKIEETKKIYLRVENGDENRTEMTMSICRSSGNGQRRVGKRKISWQDQMALKV